MKYQLIISDRARRMLGTEMRFLAQVSKKAAKEKEKQILSELRSLTEFPKRYPFFEGAYVPQNKYHKLFVEKWYLVLYQIRDDTVFVDYILDCRKENNWLN